MSPGLLDLMQLADSSFPSGAYAHSFGLEWLCRQDGFDLDKMLRVRLAESQARVDLPVIRYAYEGVEPSYLDGLMDVLMPVAELRQASRSVGRGFFRAVAKLRPIEGRFEHQPVVFGAVLRAWDLPLADGLSVYAFQSLRQQLAAAQRLGLCGQSVVQDLLHSLKPSVSQAVRKSMSIPLDETGAFTPWFDLAGIRHARQDARLFLS